MNRGIVQFSEKFVRERLGLPDDATIVGVRYDPFESSQIQIIADGPGLPEVGEGEKVPYVLLQKGRWVTFAWELPNAEG